MTVRLREQGGFLIVQPPGPRLAAPAVGPFKDILVGAVAESPRAVLLDLALVEEIDSAGLGALVAAIHCVRRHGGSLGLCGLRPQVRELLELTRLARVLVLHPTVEDAMAETAVPARAH